MATTCSFCWGTHGCELQAGDGHTVHACKIPMTDEDGKTRWQNCCEYDEMAEPDKRVRHDSARAGEEPDWTQWGPYPEGWWIP